MPFDLGETSSSLLGLQGSILAPFFFDKNVAVLTKNGLSSTSESELEILKGKDEEKLEIFESSGADSSSFSKIA